MTPRLLSAATIAAALLGCHADRPPAPKSATSSTPATTPAAPPGFLTTSRGGIILQYTEDNRAGIEPLLTTLSAGRKQVEEFFGESFPKSFIVRIYPSRAGLTA